MEAKRSYEISLAELAGAPVADIYGYIGAEFGQNNFKCTRVVFADGTWADIEGEHDFPYVSPDEEDAPALYAAIEAAEVAA